MVRILDTLQLYYYRLGLILNTFRFNATAAAKETPNKLNTGEYYPAAFSAAVNQWGISAQNRLKDEEAFLSFNSAMS